MAQKIIIAPHIDDDVLGCGGIMDKNTHVIYCGMDKITLMEDHLKKKAHRN